MAMLFRSRRWALLLLPLAGSLWGPATASAIGLCAQSTCTDTTVGDSIHRVCMPELDCWNHDLVLFAHGYVAPEEPVGIPEDQLTLPDGRTLPQIVNALGFGFATSSYPVNGLAIQPGVDDMVELVDTFTNTNGGGPPDRVYLTGASEGGLVTALSALGEPTLEQVLKRRLAITE